MELAYGSEKGLQAKNEDGLLSLEEYGLFAVCDGLSVKGGGELAVRITCEALAQWYKKNEAEIQKARLQESSKERRKEIQDSLHSALQDISKEIFQKAASDLNLHGMCTSLDLLLLLGSHCLLAHVGAGRIILVRAGESHLLTEDHTQLAHLRRMGKLSSATPQQLNSYSRRVTRAVGFQEDVKVDFLPIEMEKGDRFLLITDGVWQPLGDVTTQMLASKNADAKEILKTLHATVNDTGARDNFTSLILFPDVESKATQESAEQKIKMLGKVPTFEYLSYQELVRVISAGDLIKVGPGQVLCKEGDAGGEMMLLLSGSADIKKAGKFIRSLKKGDVFGEMSMIDAAPRSASVVSSSPTNILAFPRETIFSLFREDPELSVKFLWGVAKEINKRLRMVSNQLVGKPEQEGLGVENGGPLPFHRSV